MSFHPDTGTACFPCSRNNWDGPVFHVEHVISTGWLLGD